jgi:hypothetical protein
MRPDLITNQSAADGIARLLGDARRSAEWRPGSVGPAAVEGEPVRKRKRSSTSPTQRTLAYLRKLNWQVAVTEHWQAVPKHPAGGVRKDLWNFGDILAIGPSGTHVIIQTTSGSGTAARETKIELIPEARRWLASRGQILVIGWRKLKPRGQKVARWQPKIRNAYLYGSGSAIAWETCEQLMRADP